MTTETGNKLRAEKVIDSASIDGAYYSPPLFITTDKSIALSDMNLWDIGLSIHLSK